MFNCGVGYLVVVPGGRRDPRDRDGRAARHAGLADRRGRALPGRPVRVGGRCSAPPRPATRCGSACSSPAPARTCRCSSTRSTPPPREARVVAVASTRPGVRALERAAAGGRAARRCFSRGRRPRRAARRLARRRTASELVVCAGWMGILTPRVPRAARRDQPPPRAAARVPGRSRGRATRSTTASGHRRDGAPGGRGRRLRPDPPAEPRCRFTTMTRGDARRRVSTR